MRSDSYSRYLRSEMYKDFLNGSRKKVRPRCFFFTEFSLTAVSCRQNCVEKTNKKKKNATFRPVPAFLLSSFLHRCLSSFLFFLSLSLSLSSGLSLAFYWRRLRCDFPVPALGCCATSDDFLLFSPPPPPPPPPLPPSFIWLLFLFLPRLFLLLRSGTGVRQRHPRHGALLQKRRNRLFFLVSFLSLSLSLSRRFRFESICRPKRPRQKTKKKKQKKQPGRLVVLPLFVRILISGLFRSFLFVGFFIYLFFNVLVVIFCFFHPALSWFGSFFFDAGRFHQPKKPELITAKLNKQTHTHTTQSTNAALRKMIRPRNARADRPDLRRSASVQFQHFDVKTSTSRRIEPEEEEEEDGGDFQRIDKRHGRHRNRTRAEIRREIMERPSFL